ncbi:hypothetical protein [Nocardioides kribbensis]|uniref:hypothetical protein n=1 Tax=Nocardioides kribbensis TaxID=305517 RepID=UPI00187ADFED|nr:hypothetical protein [Nocardioides kribbensis]
MVSLSEQSADWCVDSGSVSIVGTHMAEYSRESMGERWCFTCRKRHNFDWVVMAPVGLSYYGPHVEIHGVRAECSDLFPGWSRNWGDE